MTLPFQGEVLEPQKRRFEETVLLVPFFGGKKENLRRHAEFLLELGLRVVLFENTFPSPRNTPWIFISKGKKWGLLHSWTEEIFELLHLIPGKKIIFGFSGPSAAAIAAASQRTPLDVSGMIFDSGPFFYSRHCNLNRLYFERAVTNPVKRLFLSFLHEFLWSRHHEREIRDGLARLPLDFPILSIRAGKDRLVPPWAIEAAFRGHKNLDLEVLDLKDAAHLKGLRQCPEIYKSSVARFISRVGTRVHMKAPLDHSAQ